MGRSRTATAADTSSALLTDRYELTMLEAARHSGTAERRTVFEVFARRLPEGRRYGVVAGTGRLLDELERFHFDEAELAALSASQVVDDATLDCLASWRFSGNIWGYGEGDCYFPGSPILVVESSFAEAVLLETLVLSVLNHDSAVASAASRMISAADGRPCIEMGSRRTHERSAVAAARAAFVAGFTSTSNLEAGRTYGISTSGTSAHAFVLLHDSERDAFTAQVSSLGKQTTLLVDTFDVREAVCTAIDVAGTGLGAVRLDSGDLLVQAHEVRAQLDELGATGTRIIVTSDLDEYAIAALGTAPVDGYGVGTAVVTGSGAPTAGLVYKLVARTARDGRLVPVEKKSVGKASHGGRKWAFRQLDDAGAAAAELISHADSVAAAKNARALLVPLVRDGEIVGREPVSDARARHERSLAELPARALQLSRGEPAIPTRFLEAKS